jgi:hypothetical protein
VWSFDSSNSYKNNHNKVSGIKHDNGLVLWAIVRNTCIIFGHILCSNWHFVHNSRTFSWMGLKFWTEVLHFYSTLFFGYFKKNMRVENSTPESVNGSFFAVFRAFEYIF